MRGGAWRRSIPTCGRSRVLRWLWKDKRTADDRLVTLEGFNTATEDSAPCTARSDAGGADIPARVCRTPHAGCAQTARTGSSCIVSRGTGHGFSCQRVAVAHAGLLQPGPQPADRHGRSGLQQTPPQGRAAHPTRFGRPPRAMAGRAARGRAGVSVDAPLHGEDITHRPRCCPRCMDR